MVLSQALRIAARRGDIVAIQAWLDGGGNPDERTGPHSAAHTAGHFRDARLLRPRLRQIFALRALCHRGRAAPTSATPSAFARLIGSAPASKPRTRAAAKIRSSPGLPDPLAHLVCKFWLGSPPRRRRVDH